MNTTDGTRWHTRGARRLLARLCVILGLVVCGGIWSGSAALAHHPEGTAKVDCKGSVNFTSASWLPKGWKPGADPRPRTNARVEVAYSIDQGKTWTLLPWTPYWHFNKANDFTFSGKFQLREPLPKSVIVRFQAPGPWANGGKSGRAFKTAALNIPPCEQGTTPATPGTASAPPATPTVSAIEGAPVAATERDNSAVVIVAALIGVALVIDVVAMVMFFRHRRAGTPA
jgi:hypothetical protein